MTPRKASRPRKATKDAAHADAGRRSGDEAGHVHDDRYASPDDQQDREAGYRKPPHEHRWPKGRSGNPAGRKKGSRNKRTVILRLMEQKLGRRIDDPSELTRYEALLLKGIQKALGGDIKAMAYVLRRYDEAAEAQGTSENTASERDEVVYAALVEKIRRELQEAG